MTQRVITLSFNLGNKCPTSDYLDFLASQIQNILAQKQPEQPNPTQIVISVQEQPRGFSLAEQIMLRINKNNQAAESDDQAAVYQRIGRASFTTQTKPLRLGRVTTSILKQNARDTPKNEAAISQIWQDTLCNTNKGTATVTVGQLQVSGLHLSSDNDEQRAREFYESMRIPCDGTTTYEQMQALSKTYFQRIVLGDFNYRNTLNNEQPLYEPLQQTRMLRMMGFSPAQKPKPEPKSDTQTEDTAEEDHSDSGSVTSTASISTTRSSTCNQDNKWNAEPRGEKEEKRGGFLDAIGGFHCEESKSRMTFSPVEILTNNTHLINNSAPTDNTYPDPDPNNTSDHFPVLSVATIDDDKRSSFEKVRDMVYLELQHFADETLLDQIAAMPESDENIEKLTIYFNYFMTVKHIWAQAELLRLGGDDTYTHIIGSPDNASFFTAATQTEEGQSDNNCMIAKLVKTGNETFNGDQFAQKASRAETITTLKANTQQIIKSTQEAMPTTSTTFFESCTETLSRMYRYLKRLVSKADTTPQQKREKHNEHLGSLLSRGFCTFGTQATQSGTHSNNQSVSNAPLTAHH